MASIVGQRLLPVELDAQAKSNPTKVVSTIIQGGSKLSNGCYRDVTTLDFARAVNRMCEFLEPQIGRSLKLETVAYYGPPDMRCWIIMLALSKLGFKLLLSAPRNSLTMHLHLLKDTECSTVLHAKQVNVESMLGHTHDLKKLEVQELEVLLWGVGEPRQYDFPKTWEEAKDDPFVVLHTSGSTGMPKPIPHRYSWAAIQDWQQSLPPIDGRNTVPRNVAAIGRPHPVRRYIAFPPWHTSACDMAGVIPVIFGQQIFCWGPADRMPSPQDVVDCVTFSGATEIALPSQLYTDVMALKAGMDMLGTMEVCWYGGGPMDNALGNRLSSVSKVNNIYGSTEGGFVGVQLEGDHSDWDHVYFAPTITGVEFRETTPDIYEMVFVRDPESESKHCIWSTFPNLQEFPIKDLFRKHPTKPNRWFYEGRLDDLIVYKNISKFNPLAFEEEVRTNPLIRHPIIVGTGHEQSAALIELEEAAAKLNEEDIIEQIWPTIEAANKVAPKHSLVMKTHILFAKESKPFQRTGKGTVQRNPTVRLYKEEIDELYAKCGDKKLEGGAMPSMAPTAAPVKTVNRSIEQAPASVPIAGDDSELINLQLQKLQLERQKLEIQIQEVELHIKLKEAERRKATIAH